MSDADDTEEDLCVTSSEGPVIKTPKTGQTNTYKHSNHDIQDFFCDLIMSVINYI